jgi:hypothetical protein
MNTKYESKLFNGEISSLMEEGYIAIGKDAYKNPDFYAGKINEVRLRVSNLQKELSKRLDMLYMESLSWTKNEKAISDLLTKEETTVNDRLFLRSDTDGFYRTILEDFTNASRSTESLQDRVSIDLLDHTVKLLHINELQRKLDASLYTISVSKSVGSGPERVATVPGSSLINLSQQNTPFGWIGTVTAQARSIQGLTFNITFNQPTDVGEIVFNVTPSSNSGSLSALSTNESDTSSVLLDNVNIVPGNIIPVNDKVKFVQIIFNKTNYDEITEAQDFRYIFNIKSLIVNKSVPGYSRRGIYTSNPIAIGKTSKIAIETCDYVADGVNNITYEIGFDQGGQIKFYSINPLNRPPSSAPYGIKLFENSKSNNFKNPLPVTSNPSYLFVPVDSIPTLYGFDNTYKALNHKIVSKTNNLDKIKCLINYNISGVNSDDLLEKIGQFYYTWIYIGENESRFIDTGNSGISIDRFLGSGEGTGPQINNRNTQVASQASNRIMFSKPGWYKIKIPVSSYFSVGNEFSDEIELQELDPLYPYNGKYLIEGTNLNLNPYSGFQRRAKKMLTMVDSLDLVDLSTFFLTRNIVDTEQSYVILVDKNLNAKNGYVEFFNENENQVYVTVKATLSTSDTSLSPILSSYKLKLGD